MITIKNNFLSLFSSLSTLLLISALYFVASDLVHAENSELYRNEPIFPLPLSVEVDTKKASLGERLFFDTRLSKTNTVACATCHQLETGGDDGLVKGLSISSEQHDVNTPTVFNAQFNFRHNWDGSAKTLQQQINMVMTSHHEFNNKWSNVTSELKKDTGLVKDFNQSFNEGLTENNIISAIVEFEKTLITPNSRFDRYLRNEDIALSKEEEQGYKLFKELGCISCHQGINIGGNLFQKFGVFYDYLAERGNINKADYGRMNSTGRQTDVFVFKVPSLRNVAVTAPYLHDGSAATIEEAISIMGRTQLGRTLSTKEIQLIKAFLKTLTGEYRNTMLGAQL